LIPNSNTLDFEVLLKKIILYKCKSTYRTGTVSGAGKFQFRKLIATPPAPQHWVEGGERGRSVERGGGGAGVEAARPSVFSRLGTKIQGQGSGSQQQPRNTGTGTEFYQVNAVDLKVRDLF
jgi:hypothetical protein